jgi:outer membrane protein OmpA-like peptidoglycan-associated protein
MKVSSVIFIFCIFYSSTHAQSLFDSLYQPQVVDIYFQSGKADLDDAAKAALDAAVTLFNQIKTPHTTRITAHTDSVGKSDRNEQLAQKRAQIVVEGLQNRGIPTEGIIVTAYGERQPAATNSTEDGRQHNRRASVEIARTITMATYEGKITDKNTGKGIEATLYFRSKSRADSVRTDTTGFYQVRLPKDTVVKVDVVAKGYLFGNQAFKVLGSPALYARSKSSPNIVLAPAKAGEKAVVRNLFFVGDQAVLLKASEPELPKVVKFMQVNPDIHIEIAGHINLPYQDNDARFKAMPKGMTKAEFLMDKETEPRKALSEQRAQTVCNYLVKNGISASRITCKGYKNYEMLFPHATSQEEQEQNRRVEIRVVE